LWPALQKDWMETDGKDATEKRGMIKRAASARRRCSVPTRQKYIRIYTSRNSSSHAADGRTGKATFSATCPAEQKKCAHCQLRLIFTPTKVQLQLRLPWAYSFFSSKEKTTRDSPEFEACVSTSRHGGISWHKTEDEVGLQTPQKMMGEKIVYSESSRNAWIDLKCYMFRKEKY